MKRIAVIVAALILLTTGAWAQDGKGIYNKYSDNDEVSAVYISSAMFKLMGKVPNMDVGKNSMDLGPLIKSLNAMYLLDCEDPDVCSEIKSDVNKYINKYKFEMLMEMKDKGEVVRIYTLISSAKALLPWKRTISRSAPMTVQLMMPIPPATENT